ncbi:MAG: transposase [Deltaproteobacteria bacterium]|nr:transposase [Deltaproteobacteria bacterium]
MARMVSRRRYIVNVSSYCLMGSHPHLVCRSIQGQAAFSSFWKVVNWGFAHWYNRRTSGRGQVVMERLRSPRIQDGRHQLAVMRYGDLNPVRAGVVSRASDWKWSSHCHYAYGKPDDLVTDAPEYLALGRTWAERRKAYLHLFAVPLVESLMTRRWDLVEAPFIGEERWVALRLRFCGLSPPRRATVARA